jgi:uncharacterized protein RhaS with RHS repeats
MRDYDPTTGRYLQADPLGLVDGASVYGYAAQSPMVYTDPTGEIIPLLVGIGIGVAVEYLTNPCPTWQDLALAGAIGGIGGGISKAALLRYGARSLTRVTGKEWSHSLSRSFVNRYTSGGLNRFMNARGGLNGSWVSPQRHFLHDPIRFPRGWRDFGNRFKPYEQALDRIPDWLKGTLGAGAVGAVISDSDCECR